MESVTINVNLTKDDLRQLRRDTYEHARLWFGYIAILWLLSAVPGYAAFILMGLTAFTFAGSEIRGRRALDKTFAAWADVGESTYTFGDAGVHLAHAKGERQFDWPTIVSFRDCKSALLLNYLDVQTILIPKRCLKQGEHEKLLDFLKTTHNLTHEEALKRKRSNRLGCTALVLLLALLVLAAFYMDELGLRLFLLGQR